MKSKYLYDLEEASQKQLVGGKAYGLNEMIRKGFNVPKGFVISVNSFMKMTPSLQNLILAAFDKLQVGSVAVRSSAINEDGLEDTWAGQLETYLNCRRGNLLKSVEDCWKSANSARAQSYADQKDINGTEVAVIVQEMIQSEKSGVAFSVHPISNYITQVVIEAGIGLGEAVVSGQITPDTYIVDKKSGQIIEKHLSHQNKKLVRSDIHTTVWEKIGSHGNKQKLTNEQIKELCGLTTELETFFGFPVDIEWAIYQGKIYVLQSRPITTLGHE